MTTRVHLKKLAAAGSALAVLFAAGGLAAQTPTMAPAIPTAKSVLGHNIGDDFYLANYEESIGYFHKLADASGGRMKMITAGKTTQGKVMEYAVISSAANIAKLDHYIDISKKLGAAKGLTDEQAMTLAKEGKVIIHIDGGMHASEVSDHQLPSALAYKLLATQGDPEIDAILDNVILVLWPTLNPDGQDMIVDWYRKQLGTKYETSRMPWLYQEYVGHDNNRDGYMLNMIESQVVTKAEQTYAPEIWYSQHQTAPFPARIWMPPFADPISPNISPYMRIWTNAIGTNMMARFEKEQKPGAIAMNRFDNWYAGFLDYTHVFRNTMAFFTETAHDSATPKTSTVKDFPKNMQDLKPQIWYPNPWKGGEWHLSDSVAYMVTASMSVLETGVKYHDTLLYNRYQAGRDIIKQGKTEAPYAYVIPVQTDQAEATLLAQKFIDHGLDVYEAKSAGSVGGAAYGAGSYIIPLDQPFAGLARELLEPQKYPDAILDGSGKPVDLPYDVTGWTLSMQMGVNVDRAKSTIAPAEMAALGAPVQKAVYTGGVSGAGSTFVLPRAVNGTFAVMNDVTKAKGKVAYADNGDVVVTGVSAATMKAIAAKRTAPVKAVSKAPAAVAVKKQRVALYRPWGSNIDEGWTRWLLEQYDFGATSAYNADIKAGKLKAKYDVIILPDMGGRGPRGALAGLTDGLSADSVPAAYAGGVGAEGIAALKQFVADGGTLVAFNGASDAAIDALELPVTNVLRGLTSEQFFCSGALLQVELADKTSPATAGLVDKPIVMFERGPAFEVKSGFKGKILASYAAAGNPLRSGVLIHEERLQGKAAAVEVEYGKGKVLLLGFKPQWRAQSHGTYKFVFNALYK